MRWPIMRWLILAVAILIIGVTAWRVRDMQAARQIPAVASTPVQPAQPTASTRPLRPDMPLSAEEQNAFHNQRQLEKKQAVREIVAAGRAKLVGLYQAESTDAAWANAKELELMGYQTSAQIEAAGAKPSNLAIDCKRTTCRLEADFPSRSAAEDWITLFSTESGGKLSRAIVDYEPMAGGGVHLVTHGLARE